ncbi:hypothetical protein ACH5RR_004015 [Cinchona calisaya]|uniref:Protein BIG GRAIN 1-like A n=1 Tax=Cinchona calisaya TaxID=153742 RepID=A0ABD3AWH9_9GENT
MQNMTTTWERPIREGRHQQRRKTPSFSSSLLDAIYHSIDDESQLGKEQEQRQNPGLLLHKKRNNNAADGVEEEIVSVRRAIMVEKWMENYTTSSRSSSLSSKPMNSDSSSSTDSSSLFSSSETDSASKKPTPKHESSRFIMRTKSRALKIYTDLKKVKQPISPGGKIANFLNSIFTSRNSKKHEGMEDWSSVRKSRSVKDSTLTRGKKSSNRAERFCLASIIADEDYDRDDPSLLPMPKINSHFLKKSFDSFRDYEEKKSKKYELKRGFNDYNSDDDIDEGNSCTSSDLFELENIGIVGIGHGGHREELPVYGTTNLKINQAIANGFVM